MYHGKAAGFYKQMLQTDKTVWPRFEPRIEQCHCIGDEVISSLARHQTFLKAGNNKVTKKKAERTFLYGHPLT